MTSEETTGRSVDAGPEAGRVAAGLTDLVGRTPLIRPGRIADGLPADIYVKLDQYSLGGSSKDRIGFHMVRQAIERGDLKPGGRIVDFGAGNTAIGYALAGIATGHPVTIVASDQLSPEKAQLLRFLGVDIIPGRPDVPPGDPENWATVAERYEAENPNTWWARQESSPDNPEIHRLTTGPEVWEQTGGRLTHFIAAIATGGTVSGTGTYLKERDPGVTVIGTDFADHAGTSNLLPVARRDPGWEALERDFSANINLDVIDRVEVRERPEVIDFGWQLARTEGLVLGLSSVLSLRVALDLARDSEPGTVIVVFSADSGRDYLTREYNAGWLRDNELGAIADKYAG